jgi:hypothetical protein
MSSFKELYQLRRACDPKRQPRHDPLLAALHEELSKLDPPHDDPYRLRRVDYAAYRKNDSYGSVANGGKAVPAERYCYRLTSWTKLVEEISQESRMYIDAPEAAEESEVFNLLESRRGVPGEWQSLSTLIQGTLWGRRGFTWWTTAMFPNANPMCVAHSMGLFNINVAPELLVLRCHVDKIPSESIKVPSVLDAFFFDVFSATRDDENPTCGRAINLENQSLSLGAEEYVLEPLDILTSEITVWPVDLRKEKTHKVYFEDRYEALIEYYKTLC